MKMTSFDVLFQKKMAAMFPSVSPLKNCSCIYNISLHCSCIYRSRNNRQQLSLIKRKNGIQTTSLVSFVSIVKTENEKRRFVMKVQAFCEEKGLRSFLGVFGYAESKN